MKHLTTAQFNFDEMTIIIIVYNINIKYISLVFRIDVLVDKRTGISFNLYTSLN